MELVGWRKELMTPYVGYLIPEFPGQTHVWIWREIVQLRRWGVRIRIFSTRRPPHRDRARHAFAPEAEAETAYLWPAKRPRAITGLLWASATRPVRLAQCVRLALSLPTNRRFRQLELLALLAPACELAQHCHEQGIAHLHAHSCANSAVLCMMVKRLLGIPYSLTLNANIDWWGGAMLEKFSDAEFTNTHTQWLLDQMRSDFPSLLPQQAVLGRIGVDTDIWVPRRRVPPADGRTRIISVARLHHTKAQDVLLDAISILMKEGVALSARIVGDGPARASLEAQANQLGLHGCVTFMGSLGQEKIIGLMEDSDIFVLPSRFEPLGVAYMEAMAMELATIGTTAGGVREIIEDGLDGILMPPDDARGLASAIRKLASEPALRVKMGQAGRRKIVSKFDSRIGAAMLYERLMGRSAPGAVPAVP
jgi:glycosyltransferase involved in cell wall biosynthesis